MKEELKKMKETIDWCTEGIQFLTKIKQLELDNQRNCILTYRIGEADEIMNKKGIITLGSM